MSSEKQSACDLLFTIYGCIVKKFNRLGKWETDLSCVSGSSGNFRQPCIAQGRGEFAGCRRYCFWRLGLVAQFGMNLNAHCFLRNDVKNKRSSENRFQSFRRPFIFSGKPSLSSAQYGVIDVFLDAGGNSVGALTAEGVAAEQPLFGQVGQEGIGDL